ncbi:Zinc metalloproteinase nas-7 [Orchesella cincta]|uniref:Metalloendopeptidase n=1 Tax=Orchesella cincta TaxID=48709 RepID=A0A1D2MDG5_ORCCI|nr:Zinc metalloproteinase nas-7 [Orchesella cincta]
MKLLVLVCLAFQLSLVWETVCFSTKNSIPKAPNLDKKAISLVKGVKCSLQNIPKGHQRNGIVRPGSKWTNFFIYIDPSYSTNDRALINNAAYWLGRMIPCVSFGVWRKGQLPTAYNDTYIHIKKTGSGCWSYVGKWELRPQEMSLDPGCMTMETIMHEMIHALGFDHEQCRPDRDRYVKINWENIEPERKEIFEKLTYANGKTFDVPYNTKSIMHYSSYDFSSNGMPTILTKNGNIIDNRDEVIQWTDIQKLMMMYQC